MAKNLIIVESPGKIKKIQSFLGKDFRVIASYGHVRDLAKGSKGIDKENDFQPNYVISPDKKDVVKGLKKLAEKAETVYLAGDADREGEAISWHVKEIIKVPESKIKRIVFTEITKKAIEHAIKNPIELNQNLVNAQQARRVLDRLVGFDLSPLLWKKIKPKLSGGRVQSVAVKILTEREKEINKFKTSSDFNTKALFKFKNYEFKSTLNKRFKKKGDAKLFLEKCIGSSYEIESIEKKPGKKSSPAPFTTSTLQQAASSRLGFSLNRIMSAAQSLYEEGLVTYMRTDSVMLSEEAIKSCSSEINKKYGKKYSNPKRYKGKSKGAQEAHEAIRPVYMDRSTAGSSSDTKKLYELIWKRTMASQMSDAKVERTTVNIGISKSKEKFITKGEIVTFDGFLKLYTPDQKAEDDDKGILPNFKKGDNVKMLNIESGQSFKKPSSRYTESSIVKKLEDLGIGRPSTYASIISTIQKRGYVEIKDIEPKKIKTETLTLEGKKISEESKDENFGGEKKKMVPTDIGILVTDFLVEHFDQVMNYNFTANVENQFDEIAKGNSNWTSVIKDFYEPFKEKVKNAGAGDEKVGVRSLGKDPSTKMEVFARHGRFGPMVQLGDKKEDGDKVKFAKIGKDNSVDEITLEQALELLKWPRIVGKHKKKDVSVSIGKFGPYVKYDGNFTSIGEEQDPLKITLKECVELIKESEKEKKKRVIKEFKSKDIYVLNGKYGPYIKKGSKNFKIPEYEEANSLTLKKCEDIIKNSKKRKRKPKK